MVSRKNSQNIAKSLSNRKDINKLMESTISIPTVIKDNDIGRISLPLNEAKKRVNEKKSKKLLNGNAPDINEKLKNEQERPEKLEKDILNIECKNNKEKEKENA